MAHSVIYFFYVRSIQNIIDVDDNEVLMAGLVDTSVHIQEPGRAEWEGFASATKAAGAWLSLLDV